MSEREDVLDRRVRWLDRWRRVLAVGVGALIAVLLGRELAEVMDTELRSVTIGVTLTIGLVSWLVFEVALASVTALWESELDRLLDLRGMPRAELHSRRWRPS